MKVNLLILCTFMCCLANAQHEEEILPIGMTEAEKQLLQDGQYISPQLNSRGIETPPPHPVRSMAEWEEMQAIVVTWRFFNDELTEIVRYAKEEVEVIIVARPQDVTSVQNILDAADITMDNITIIEQANNSVWVRDYGGNPVYANDVDSLYLVDWIYNRPRPLDDVVPEVIGQYFDIPVYNTTEAPLDLVNTGGNYFSDGLGTAFSSDLVLDENASPSGFGDSFHSEEDIDSIMLQFMGIHNYIKLEKLPYDGIHHLDMHMKLLDEKTLLVGEFPEGVSDGPQLEANLLYLQENYKTPYGTDYRIERIIQPPCNNGQYPPNCSSNAEYRTYTNAMFVNKTILIPTYNEATDQEALDRWAELMPGYKIRGIDCTDIINSGGAIHCITKEVGVDDPLWISHGELEDLNATENDALDHYTVNAIIKHRSGINFANLWWSVDTTSGYNLIPMNLTDADNGIWSANIPHQEPLTQVFYYITAEANAGKEGIRPLVAPEGYFEFEISDEINNTVNAPESGFFFDPIFPNPASAITVIPVRTDSHTDATISIKDALGKTILSVFEGHIAAGQSNYFFDARALAAGTYFVHIEGENWQEIQKVIVTK